MYSVKRNLTLVLLMLLCSFTALQAQSLEYQIDGMTFGMPEARVYTDDYDGPPVVGDYISMLPNLVPLDYEGNKHHHIRMDTMVQEIEVANGVRYRAWTFGGTVPGPVIHVKEGDRITFTMTNRSDERVTITQPGAGSARFLQQTAANNFVDAQPSTMPMRHSMDSHSGTVAASDKWRTIAPGQTTEFDFVANYPGTYLYHCGTPSVLMHTAMGQHGVMVVSPKDGYTDDYEVDREYVVVQSEYYLRPGAGEL